jgi:hypothetical protein
VSVPGFQQARHLDLAERRIVADRSSHLFADVVRGMHAVFRAHQGLPEFPTSAQASAYIDARPALRARIDEAGTGVARACRALLAAVTPATST